MDNTTLKSFMVAGIAVKTSNEVGKGVNDIAQLWHQFMADNVAQKIPDSEGDEVFCVYTDYEGDHTKPYTVIIGKKVSTLDGLPEGLVGKKIEAGPYRKFVAEGDLAKGVVANAWYKIWEQPLDRVYATDFEIYGKFAQDPYNAKVDIFIGVA